MADRRVISAEVVQAALDALLAGLEDRADHPLNRVSVAKTRIRALQRQIDQQATDPVEGALRSVADVRAEEVRAHPSPSLTTPQRL